MGRSPVALELYTYRESELPCPTAWRRNESVPSPARRDNPVDWYPVGDEALRKAREEDKPILSASATRPATGAT